MSTRDRIARFIERRGSANSAELGGYLDISRQAVNAHLRALLDAGTVVKTGSTRNARYHAPSQTPAPASFSRVFGLAGLDESRVYARIATTLSLRRILRANVESILHYAFTEILNNAIDHSQADKCRVRLVLGAGKLLFEIRETGIGVFRSIRDKLDLEDEQEAMIELVKGKTTTMPQAHTGEGIFFTSKVADRFSIRSHKIQIEWDRKHDDVFVSTPHFRKGTTVIFEIRPDSRTKLEDIFSEYAPEEYDYEFQKTRVHVKLLDTEYISRSEAKRLAHNLNRFLHVELDFRGVDAIGQGFADEIFRVFAQDNPDTKIVATNLSRNVAAMIRHAGGAVIQ
ncbi:MAG: STAS-like domain-containing protein [Woeseia sp.]